MNKPVKKSLEEMTKVELLQKCKQYRFVLIKLNNEIKKLEEEIQELRKKK